MDVFSEVDFLDESVWNEMDQRLFFISREYQFCETKNGFQHRDQLVKLLKEMADSWVRSELVALGCSDEVVEKAECRLIPYGSYALGVCSPTSDIDIACFVPGAVTVDSFFTSFYTILKSHNLVSSIRALPTAFVPIINAVIAGISFDIPFISLSSEQFCIPESLDILNDAIYESLSLQAAHSIQGPRCSLMILSMIPNHDIFVSTLNVLKLFAKQRGIYKNMYGFFGGVNLAILLVNLYIQHPHYSISQLICSFFLYYSAYNWNEPVQLTPVTLYEKLEINKEVWRINGYKRDYMVILTPLFPSINSMRSCCRSSFEVMIQEFSVANTIINNWMKQSVDISELFEQVSFMSIYPYYLRLTATASHEQQFIDWSSWCESKLRVMTALLEKQSGVLAVVGDVEVRDVLIPNRVSYYIGIWLDSQLEKQSSINLSQPANTFIDILRYEQEEGEDFELNCLTREEVREAQKAMNRIESDGVVWSSDESEDIMYV